MKCSADLPYSHILSIFSHFSAVWERNPSVKVFRCISFKVKANIYLKKMPEMLKNVFKVLNFSVTSFTSSVSDEIQSLLFSPQNAGLLRLTEAFLHHLKVSCHFCSSLKLQEFARSFCFPSGLFLILKKSKNSFFFLNAPWKRTHLSKSFKTKRSFSFRLR